MRPRRSYTFLVIVLLPILFILRNPQLTDPLRSGTFTLLKPFFVTGASVVTAASNLRDNLYHFWNTFRGEARSEARIAELESRLVRFDEAVRENERLKKLLDFKDAVSEKSIAARVIAWDLSPWRKTVVLDKGKNQGLGKDMPVIVPEGLVGRIIEVGPATARVILLIDADARVSATAEQSRAQGVVMGDGSSQLKMSYLDLDAGVAVEETVLTSGIGGLFPKGLRIGKIVTLGKAASGLHLEARVRPFAAFSKLEEVLCLASFQAG